MKKLPGSILEDYRVVSHWSKRVAAQSSPGYDQSPLPDAVKQGYTCQYGHQQIKLILFTYRFRGAFYPGGDGGYPISAFTRFEIRQYEENTKHSLCLSEIEHSYARFFTEMK